MKSLFILLLIALSINVSAQSPFHRMPKPAMKYGVSLAAPVTITAWRFTGPIAGYMYPQSQVVTGLGYGYCWMHFVDSTQRYYTTFSISPTVFAGGNVTPSITSNNIMSTAVMFGFANQLFMVGPCYNFASPNNSKGSFGVVVSISVPLN
jgi:hypothetical protein